MKQQWLDRSEQLLLIVLSGFLFWGNAVSSIAIGILAILGIVRGGWKELTTWKTWVLLIPPGILLISWLSTGLESDGMREMQLWPTWIAALLYFSTTRFSDFFRKSFAWMALAQALLVLTFFAFSSPLEHPSFAQGFRDAMEDQFNVHPTFVSVSWFWAAILFFTNLKKSVRIRIGAIVFLVIMASLCGGKMPMLAFVLVSITIAILRINSSKGRAIALGGITVLALLNALYNPVLTERFEELYQVDLSYTEGQALSSSELRLGIWNCSIEVTMDNWIWGVGVGNTRAKLEACYEQYNQLEFFEGEYNTHNQYLHFWLVGGFLSFISLLGFFGFLVSNGISNSQGLILFMCFFMLICLTENYLSRQFGMMFFCFFTASYLFERKNLLSEASNPSS